MFFPSPDAFFCFPEAVLIGSTVLEVNGEEMRRASSSGSRWVQLHQCADVRACAALLAQRGGFYSVGTALKRGVSTNIYGPLESGGVSLSLLHPRLAIWVGNEAKGLSEAAMRSCDELVHLPMRGMVESLNVAACAAVVLSEVCRQRAASGLEFAPEGEEAARILEHLTRANRRIEREDAQGEEGGDTEGLRVRTQ